MKFQEIAMILAGVAILVLLGLWAMGDLKVLPPPLSTGSPFGTAPHGDLPDKGQNGKIGDWSSNLSSLPVAVTAGGLDLANGPP